mgnify:CR=1 FL=1
MKKIIHLTVFLALVSALAGSILSYVNAMTSPIIEERKIAAVKSSLQEIFPSTNEFKEIDFKDDSETINNVYEAVGAGYAFNVSVQGYKEPIEYIVGVDTDGNVLGFIVTYVNDTPGLGTKVGDPAFAESIVGKTISGSFDTISGATISSSAAISGLANVSKVLESLK